MSGSDGTSRSTPASGGVLSDGAIIERIVKGELIALSTFNEDSLHGSSYDVAIAQDGLITPSRDEVPPCRTAVPWTGPVVIESGETALFSSKELFRLPDDVAGNVSIKNRLASQGLSLLSGLLIDPGYGLDEFADDRLGCRLFLHVANTSRSRIVLVPGVDVIARVQFLPIVGPRWSKRKSAKASRWSEQKRASLGFFTEMRELKQEVEETSTRSRQIVLFGVVVVAIALVGAAFSSILSIATNSNLSEKLHDAWPASSNDALVWSSLLLAVSVVLLAVVLACEKLLSKIDAARWERRKRRRDAF